MNVVPVTPAETTLFVGNLFTDIMKLVMIKFMPPPEILYEILFRNRTAQITLTTQFYEENRVSLLKIFI
jgi:hypothetical protein